MTDKEDNFNEFLKQKVEESHFEYNESYWLKAEKLIEDAQPKKKPFWWGFGFGMLSLAIIGGLTALIFKSNGQDAVTLHQTLQHPSATAIEAEKTDGNENVSSKEAVTATVMHDQNTAVSAPLLASKASYKHAYAKAGNMNASMVKNVGSSNVSKNIATKNNATATIDYSKLGNTSKVRNLSANKVPVSDMSMDEEEEKSDKITIASPIIIDARKPSVNNSKNNKDIDVNIVAACDNKNKHEFMFNLLAGVSDSRGFEGNTLSDSKIGFGYFGGLRLAYKLDKNWFVGLQPLLYSRGAVNTSIETEKTDYDFGANADEFVVKNKALLFAELPLSIGYRIQRHQISAGAGFEYLLNVKSDVKEFGSENYTPNQWGYTQGFNRFGTVAMFNYAFNIYNEFWLTMMVQKGFTDLTKADYFTTNSKDKNFNLRIGVQYQFNNQKKKGK